MLTDTRGSATNFRESRSSSVLRQRRHGTRTLRGGASNTKFNSATGLLPSHLVDAILNVAVDGDYERLKLVLKPGNGRLYFVELAQCVLRRREIRNRCRTARPALNGPVRDDEGTRQKVVGPYGRLDT